jgi:uncharacterized protein
MDLNERGNFLNAAAILEGLLIALSFGLGWAAGINPMATFHPNLPALALGILGTVPLWLFFAVTYRYPVGPFRAMKRLLVELLGPPLSACRWYDLLLLALLVGFAEELLFRGLLQPWFESGGGPIAGLLGSNLLFGLAHAVTPFYAFATGLIGMYLGWLIDVGPERNLAVPIVTHAAYDFVGFLAVARSYRRQNRSDERSPASDPSSDGQDAQDA